MQWNLYKILNFQVIWYKTYFDEDSDPQYNRFVVARKFDSTTVDGLNNIIDFDRAQTRFNSF